jgi:hypothetical protein
MQRTLRTMFLSDYRRKELLSVLCDRLSMPVRLAARWAWVPHHLCTVDGTLAQCIELMGQHVDALASATERHDHEVVERYESYLQAEAAIIHAYLGEINERKLSRHLFPRTNSAMQESIHVVRGAKLDIMKSVGFTGVLQ